MVIIFLKLRPMRIRPINKLIKSTFGKIFGPFVGISLCPFGIYFDKSILMKPMDNCLLNHEKIHWHQQMEMLIIPFYIWYVTEYLIKRKIDKTTAYVSLSFERESYINQYDLDYLKKRKPYSWVKYLKIKKNGRVT